MSAELASVPFTKSSSLKPRHSRINPLILSIIMKIPTFGNLCGVPRDRNEDIERFLSASLSGNFFLQITNSVSKIRFSCPTGLRINYMLGNFHVNCYIFLQSISPAYFSFLWFFSFTSHRCDCPPMTIGLHIWVVYLHHLSYDTLSSHMSPCARRVR